MVNSSGLIGYDHGGCLLTVRQGEKERQKKEWGQYLLACVGFLLTALLVVAVVHFWNEMRDVESLARHYGYLGGFLVSIMGGITIVPVPSLIAIFTLGGVLNPVYVGLVSGLGEALGGITVYLTGAGGGVVWSKLRSRQPTFDDQPRPGYDIVTPVQSKLHSRWQTLYNRLAGSVGRRRGFWLVFIASAMVFSPFYFAALAAGTLHMGLKRFFLVTWAGKTVKGLMVAYAGYWGLYLLLQWIGD